MSDHTPRQPDSVPWSEVAAALLAFAGAIAAMILYTMLVGGQ